MLLLLVLFAPAISADCSSDLDCNLNGDCISGNCVCWKPWAGQSCESLAFAPAHPIAAYGMMPKVTSWGGNALFIDGEWHLFVAEMANGCGLSTWGVNSQVVDSITPLEPYSSGALIPLRPGHPRHFSHSNGSVCQARSCPSPVVP